MADACRWKSTLSSSSGIPDQLPELREEADGVFNCAFSDSTSLSKASIFLHRRCLASHITGHDTRHGQDSGVSRLIWVFWALDKLAGLQQGATAWVNHGSALSVTIIPCPRPRPRHRKVAAA
jgi:hypothetical protein